MELFSIKIRCTFQLVSTKNPLAGLILRMFNLPTGTILINVWIKVGVGVGRLRLY